MNRTRALGALLVGLGLGLGCASTPPMIPACSSLSSPNSICGLMNPEDLALLPGGGWIVVSQMAPMAGEAASDAAPGRPGSLLAIRLSDIRRKTVFPARAEWPGDEPPPGRPGWGEAGCTEPPDPGRFEPHGLDVGRHGSGAPMLAVVNHGGREAVELFEIGEGPDARPSLSWRGCVEMPERVMANDVALLRDGGFVVTDFMRRTEGGVGFRAMWSGLGIATGGNTGSVYRWSPGGSVERIPGSAGSAPNGIVLSADERRIFFAAWGSREIHRLDLDGGGRPARTSVRLAHRPDNLTWTADGRLLVAGQAGSLRQVLGCGQVERGSCGLPYGVYAIDPESLEATLLFEGEGAASVALEVGDQIFVGTFSGDRIERVRRPD